MEVIVDCLSLTSDIRTPVQLLELICFISIFGPFRMVHKGTRQQDQTLVRHPSFPAYVWSRRSDFLLIPAKQSIIEFPRIHESCSSPRHFRGIFDSSTRIMSRGGNLGHTGRSKAVLLVSGICSGRIQNGSRLNSCGYNTEAVSGVASVGSPSFFFCPDSNFPYNRRSQG